MKFAILGHLINKNDINDIPKEWIKNDIILSPEVNINETKGHIIGIKLTAKDIMSLPRNQVREIILNAAVYAQNELGVELIQLGALTTSVTSGGEWFIGQKEYEGFVNHGDSYTASVTCRAVFKSLKELNKNPMDLTLAVVGSYGVIGETVSKILVPEFKKTVLIGRREEKLKNQEKNINGNFETTVDLKTREADVIITSTNHPKALLDSQHLKKNAIVIDVSQPPNLSYEVCKKRKDVIRIDGGYVDFPSKYHLPIPGMPVGKNFACIAEVIMQALEDERENHVGPIDIKYMRKTEKWAEKYGFTLNELTNFGKRIRTKSCEETQ